MPHTPPRRRARTYHGVSIGILMVNTRFTRFPGDIGNALAIRPKLHRLRQNRRLGRS